MLSFFCSNFLIERKKKKKRTWIVSPTELRFCRFPGKSHLIEVQIQFNPVEWSRKFKKKGKKEKKFNCLFCLSFIGGGEGGNKSNVPLLQWCTTHLFTKFDINFEK